MNIGNTIKEHCELVRCYNMERGLLMADNHKRSDPIIASKSKSVGSFVKIDSISIDLADANVKSSSSHAAKCEHFSIR